MALGFVCGEGDWNVRLFNTNSAATFLKGSLVALNGARDVVEYTSVMSAYLGVALQDSVNSLPVGKVLVAIPQNGAIATTDVAPGLVISSLSIGEAMGCGKRANYMSFVTDDTASVWSAVLTIAGSHDSTSGQSRIKVAFIRNGAELWSNSSVSIG
jgi:hypothetical protein